MTRGVGGRGEALDNILTMLLVMRMFRETPRGGNNPNTRATSNSIGGREVVRGMGNVTAQKTGHVRKYDENGQNSITHYLYAETGKSAIRK